jgi:hypothetical protein
MKKFSYAAGAVFLCFTLFSCGGNGDQPKNDASAHDSDSIKRVTVTVNDTLPKKITGNYDRIYNDIARYLAGMKPEPGCKLDTSYTNNADWKKYADAAESKWMQYDTMRIQVLKNWSKRELAGVDRPNHTLFYPFSGPDILHGNSFFQHADTTVMIGLEPVGTTPFLSKNNSDTLKSYFQSVNASLYAILNFSFFRTIAMKKDLRSAVNGTTPIMMIFLERTGNRVLDVKPIHIDENGKRVFDEKGHGGYKMPGVDITYCKSDSTGEAHVLYFSCDLSNEGFEKTCVPFVTFLQSLGHVNTYLKSASYLMYNDFFSGIRNLIIAQSDHVLQDDSGIPNRFMDPKVWDHRLFGRYTGVISLFKGDEQHDLDSLFKHDPNRKDLEFGIGYKWQKGTSNLVLYTKKGAAL